MLAFASSGEHAMGAQASWLMTGGEMSELIRTKDWSVTPLGPIDAWPQGLRITLNLCLASPQPVLVAWGPEHVLLYNEAYRERCGGKPPALLGQTVRAEWRSDWPSAGALLETAQTGKPLVLEEQRVFLDRQGLLEEAFFTCAFSPLHDEAGRVTGVWNLNTETTAAVLGSRRSRVLRDMTTRLARADSLEALFALASQVLEEAALDLPFVLFYLRDERGGSLRWVGGSGLPPGSAALPPVLEPEARPHAGWPVSELLRTHAPVRVEHLEARFGPLGCGPYPEGPSQAVLLPLQPPGHDAPLGVMVAGVSARLALDAPCSEFHQHLVSALTTALARLQPRSVRPGPSSPDILPPGVSSMPEPSRTPSRFLPGHLLLVAEDADRREHLRCLLLAEGWSVHAVEAGAQALAALRARPPDVVLGTLGPTCPDGLALLRELRAAPPLQATSFLLCARAEEVSSLEALGVGADDCLVQPFSDRELVARVQSRLALARMRRMEEGYLEQLHHLFRNSPAAIAVLTGPNHVFEFVNARYEALTRDRAHLLGRSFLHVFPELGAQGFAPLDQIYRTGEPFIGREVALLLDLKGLGQREQGHYNFSFHPYTSPDGRVQGIVASVVDITEWVRSRQQAEQRAAELEAVIQSIPDAVCIADGTGIIRSTRLEPGLLRVTGIEAACARALQGESSLREVHAPMGPDGEERIIRSATEPVRLRDQIVGAVSLNMDITERKRAEAEREVLLASEQAARAEAEHANRRKDEFLARISHELATPLVGMRLWLDLLQTDERKRPEALGALRQCIQTQSKLVHDLLDTARALNGKLTVSMEACEPGEPLQAAVSAIRPLADQKGVALKLLLRQTSLVLADPERLRQVVSNLLANAVKFTPTGGKVEVRLEPQQEGVAILVQDTGRGFPPDFQSLLFTPFRQEEEGTTRSNGGLGLGLAIVRQLVELHRGRVWAHSPGRGQGATFGVWLPALEESVEDAPLEESQEAMGRQLEGLRLLLVEDDALTRMAVLSVFEQQGAEVQAVGSAQAALELVRSTPFDAMLCDIAMPGEDGYSLIRKVRTLPPPANQLPAAAFTAHMRDEDRTHALLAGFQMHIAKAVEPAQLISQVRLLALEGDGKA